MRVATLNRTGSIRGDSHAKSLSKSKNLRRYSIQYTDGTMTTEIGNGMVTGIDTVQYASRNNFPMYPVTRTLAGAMARVGRGSRPRRLARLSLGKDKGAGVKTPLTGPLAVQERGL